MQGPPSKVARIREAAERGEMDAHYAQGFRLCGGPRVEVDLARTHFWLSSVSAQCDQDADQLRNIIGSQLSAAELIAAKELAAAYGVPHLVPTSKH